MNITTRMYEILTDFLESIYFYRNDMLNLQIRAFILLDVVLVAAKKEQDLDLRLCQAVHRMRGPISNPYFSRLLLKSTVNPVVTG